jgi:hypothetical protein
VPGVDTAREVEVVVNEARDDGRAGDVDDLRAGARIARHLRARAARDDPTVVDRERFDDAEVRVDGQDLAVCDDGVDLLLRERWDGRECGEDGDGNDQTGACSRHKSFCSVTECGTVDVIAAVVRSGMAWD